jgi:hypothetical protein
MRIDSDSDEEDKPAPRRAQTPKYPAPYQTPKQGVRRTDEMIHTGPNRNDGTNPTTPEMRHTPCILRPTPYTLHPKRNHTRSTRCPNSTCAGQTR